MIDDGIVKFCHTLVLTDENVDELERLGWTVRRDSSAYTPEQVVTG